jgi:hypothetical protein
MRGKSNVAHRATNDLERRWYYSIGILPLAAIRMKVKMMPFAFGREAVRRSIRRARFGDDFLRS